MHMLEQEQRVALIEFRQAGIEYKKLQSRQRG